MGSARQFAADYSTARFGCVHFKPVVFEPGVITELEDAGARVILLDGARMTTPDGLFDQLSAGFQLPDYFGRNWDALDECLCDLATWLPASGYVARVTGAAEFWRVAPQLAGMLIESWLFCAEDWARTSTPFHLIFILEDLDEP